MGNNRNIRTITGIVYSAKKDHNGKVVSVLIDSMDEDQEIYKISPGKITGKLLELINKKVEVYGSVSEDVKGDLIINVINLTLLEET